MREHQIVITLKPDQFLEVQRLSRAANAKSMGVFVRQKLLAALGIEGVLKTEDASAVDVEQILSDLQRLHGELKSFVAESLSPYSVDAFAQVDPAEDQDLQQLNLFVQDDVVSPVVTSVVIEDSSDTLEKTAERAFAISPRLGEIGDPEPIPEPELLPFMPERNVAAATDRAPQELTSRHEMHVRRDVHRYNHPHAASEFMDVPFTGEQPFPFPDEEFLAAQPTSSTTGSTASKRPTVDPLSKLLSTEELSKRPLKPRLEPENDDDALQVPLSIAEQRKNLTSNETDDEFVRPEKLHPSAAAVMAAQDAEDETIAPNAPSTPIITETSILPTGLTSQDDETGITSGSLPTETGQNEPNRPLGYPPLSGSPPPKRRQV